MQKPKQFKPKRNVGVKKFNGNEERNSLYDSTEWIKYRFRFLHHNPKCYACGSPAKHVDHILPVRTTLEGFWITNNHCPLCHNCHSYVTAKFDRHNPPKTEEKIKWLDSERKLRNIKTPIKVLNVDNKP